MSFIYCLECGEDLSVNDTICPNCGCAVDEEEIEIAEDDAEEELLGLYMEDEEDWD